jgi:hypothetical protein
MIKLLKLAEKNSVFSFEFIMRQWREIAEK